LIVSGKAQNLLAQIRLWCLETKSAHSSVLCQKVSTRLNSFNILSLGNITWKNLDPGKVVKEVSNLLDLGLVENFFERAGIGSAYLDRPCIDPLDPECPSTAPNYFNRCKALKKFMTWNDALPDNERFTLTEEVESKGSNQPQLDLISDILGRKKRQTTPTKNGTRSKSDNVDYYAYEDDKDYESGAKTGKYEKTKIFIKLWIFSGAKNRSECSSLQKIWQKLCSMDGR
jgi:hypothetical protein